MDGIPYTLSRIYKNPISGIYLENFWGSIYEMAQENQREFYSALAEAMTSAGLPTEDETTQVGPGFDVAVRHASFKRADAIIRQNMTGLNFNHLFVDVHFNLDENETRIAWANYSTGSIYNPDKQQEVNQEICKRAAIVNYEIFDHFILQLAKQYGKANALLFEQLFDRFGSYLDNLDVIIAREKSFTDSRYTQITNLSSEQQIIKRWTMTPITSHAEFYLKAYQRYRDDDSIENLFSTESTRLRLLHLCATILDHREYAGVAFGMTFSDFTGVDTQATVRRQAQHGIDVYNFSPTEFVDTVEERILAQLSGYYRSHYKTTLRKALGEAKFLTGIDVPDKYCTQRAVG